MEPIIPWPIHFIIVYYLLFLAVAYNIIARWLFFRKKMNNPESYADYLAKLSYITRKPVHILFVIAGEESKIPKYMIRSDLDKYLDNLGDDDYLPSYVKEFLDEGKEIIKETKVSIFNLTGV